MCMAFCGVVCVSRPCMFALGHFYLLHALISALACFDKVMNVFLKGFKVRRFPTDRRTETVRTVENMN